MSEAFEGIVAKCDGSDPINWFAGLQSALRLRLVHFGGDTWGIYHSAPRDLLMRTDEIEILARELSHAFPCLAVYYNNGCDVSESVLHRQGVVESTFGLDDELWSLIDESGRVIEGSPRLLPADLDPDVEYDCVTTAIDLGLQTLGVASNATEDLLKDAFTYDRLPIVLETHPRSAAG